MKDYSIDDVVRILEDLDISSISEDFFRDTRQVIYSNNYRNKDNNLIYDSLLNKQYIGVLKSDYNAFKIFFEHPLKKSKDFVL